MIIGISASPIICITPLSIDTAWSNLEESAVTKAGQDNSDCASGNNADGTWFLIFSIICSWFFSIKNTGTLFFIKEKGVQKYWTNECFESSFLSTLFDFYF